MISNFLFCFPGSPQAVHHFYNFRLAVLKGDLQKTRGKSKGEGRKGKEEEKCGKAWGGCFHTSPLLEEAIICLHCSHPVVVTLENVGEIKL